MLIVTLPFLLLDVCFHLCLPFKFDQVSMFVRHGEKVRFNLHMFTRCFNSIPFCQLVVAIASKP
jgi:hypothetical protein